MSDRISSDASPATRSSVSTRHGVRAELVVMVAFWLTMAVWVLVVCFLLGYRPDPAETPLVLGMPAWVVWGVFMPWCVSTLFTIWFALFKMSDEGPSDTGDTHDD